MKRIAATVGMVIFLFLTPAFGDQESDANENSYLVSDSEIEIAEHDDVTVLTISGSRFEDRNAPVAPYLTRYYFEKGGFREVGIFMGMLSPANGFVLSSIFSGRGVADLESAHYFCRRVLWVLARLKNHRSMA
ncbi:MAG: hypothetical protein HF978_18790 [Desulfobacteraceae bacterium]|nr:hypothetical protein [Desulfobacteraceae bacterium]MBC2757595.1 hypothetical protein [Desulfobacteraceae bacterium]